MNCSNYTISTACGVGIFGNFGSDYGYDPDIRTCRNRGGIGYAIAGFVNTKTCKKAYEILASRFEIVFQSPVKINRNSGRNFFFCVYKER